MLESHIKNVRHVPLKWWPRWMQEMAGGKRRLHAKMYWQGKKLTMWIEVKIPGVNMVGFSIGVPCKGHEALWELEPALCAMFQHNMARAMDANGCLVAIKEKRTGFQKHHKQ